MVERRIIEQVAGALALEEGLVEKDWHVVRALKAIETLEHEETKAVFSGGTSLSKGWGLIKRFSEDIDFKVAMKDAENISQGRRKRREYRERVLALLQANGFSLVNKPAIGNQSQYFSAELAYESLFRKGQGLRRHIRIEMSFQKTALEPINRPIQSIIAKAQKRPPEVSAFPCVDPIETAADKLSALAWRVCSRKRGTEGDDPAIIRHMHDLAALAKTVGEKPRFAELVNQAMAGDAEKKRIDVTQAPAKIFAEMIRLLSSDPLWEKEYEEFVLQVSFAEAHEKIGFAEALAVTKRLADLV